MSKNLIYGIDPDADFTPHDVRDAMVKCFIETNRKSLGKDANEILGEADEMMLELVIRAFNDSGGNFEEPTKKDCLRAAMELKKFTEKFRDPELVESHFKAIKGLLNKLD